MWDNLVLPVVCILQLLPHARVGVVHVAQWNVSSLSIKSSVRNGILLLAQIVVCKERMSVFSFKRYIIDKNEDLLGIKALKMTGIAASTSAVVKIMPFVLSYATIAPFLIGSSQSYLVLRVLMEP